MNLYDLYEKDETAWLDRMVELCEADKHADLDLANLVDFLECEAHHDERETERHLEGLIEALLKWGVRGDAWPIPWRLAILHWRDELEGDVDADSLRRHAVESIPAAYRHAVGAVVFDTGLPPERFPTDCPWTLDELLKYSPAP